MSRHVSRSSFALAFVVFLSTLASGSASAKECKNDSDCAVGFECIFHDVMSGTGGSAGSGSAGSAGVGNASGAANPTSAPGAGAAAGTACAGPDCAVSSGGTPAQPPKTMPSTPEKVVPPQPVDGGVAAPPTSAEPGPATPIGTPVVSVGVCQVKILTCTRKADCPANLDCVKSSVTVAPTTPACPPNTICDSPSPGGQTSDPGICKAVCNVDSDCPAPLVCKLQGQACMGGGSVSKDGTVTTMPTTCSGGQKLCTYEPVVCSTDQACAPNYQCAKVSEYQSCPGSAPAGCPRSTDGADVPCSTPTTAPEPPVCTSTVVNNCLPKQINCDAGQSCPIGWTCFDLTPFDNGSVPGWSTPMPSKACLPDGLILTIKGQASGGTTTYQGGSPTGSKGGSGSVDLGLSGSAGAGGPASNAGESSPPNVAPATPSDGQGHTVAGDAGSEPATTTVRGGGCAVGGVRSGSFDLALTLGLAGLVLRLIRRRK